MDKKSLAFAIAQINAIQSFEQKREKAVEIFQSAISKNWGGNAVALGQKFSATPQVEQILIGKIIEQGGAFMRDHVRVLPVNQMVGERIIMSPSGSSASRTNTATTDREPKDISNLETRGYECKKVENDVKIPYALIDLWANQFATFSPMWQAYLLMQMVNDIVKAGFNGVTAAASTNLSTYPMLQDLQIGWLQRMRAFNSGSNWQKGKALACTFTDTGDVVTSAAHGLVNGQVIQFSTVTTTTGISEDTDYYVVSAATDTFKVSSTKGGAARALTTDGTGEILAPISVGSGKDYANLDVLINEIVYEIPMHLRTNLVVYLSEDLIKSDKATFFSATVDRAEEKLLLAQFPIELVGTWGGLRAFTPPFMPSGTILVCPQGSLQYYAQNGSRRRKLEDWPRRDCYNDWNSVNSGYQIEQEESCFLMEMIDTF